MPSRQLDFPVFDGDNHMYETTDAAHEVPRPRVQGVIDYVDVDGRTKIAVKGQISEYIPNPTFDKVAAPGAQEEYFRNGNPEGKTRREIMGKAIVRAAGVPRARPRIELMDELGIDRALMWPTLASLVEERLRDDPHAIHAVINALNQWMYETWSFNFEDRIFATPVITLADPGQGDRGARVGGRARGQDHPRAPGAGARLQRHALVRAARVRPVLGAGAGGRTSSSACTPATAATSATSTSGRAWRRRVPAVRRPVRLRGHRRHGSGRAIVDTIASAIGHGMLTRFPDAQDRPGRERRPAGSGHSFDAMHHAYLTPPARSRRTRSRCSSATSTCTRSTRTTPSGLADLIGVDNVLFGSDYPHPEGLADPISFVDDLDGLADDDVAKVMGGNLARLMGTDEHAKV